MLQLKSLNLCAFTFFAIVFSFNFAFAQFPTAQLHSVFPLGGQSGKSVAVSVNGIQTDDATELRFSDPRIQVTKKTGTAFNVSIPAGIEPGMYDVRTYDSLNGLSNPRLFVVDVLSESRSNEKNNSRETAQPIELESIVNGRCKVESSDYYKIHLPEGKRILIECMAYRTDTKLDGVLVLTDPYGKEIAKNNDALRDDPLIDFTVPKSGEYILEVRDFLHRGGPDYGYRLKASAAPRIDYVFPPSGIVGTKSKFKLYGRNLYGGKMTDVLSLDGKQLEVLEVEIELSKAGNPHAVYESMLELRELDQNRMMYHVDLPNGRSNSVPIFFANASVAMEVEPNNSPELTQRLTIPCEVAGQFNPKGDHDLYSFQAERDDELWIEINSSRMGYSTDPSTLLQQVVDGDEKLIDVTVLDDSKYFTPEERQASSTDLTNNDIAYKFTVPRTGTYRLTVRDINYQSRGSSQYVYRLSIRKPQPDFQLIAFADHPSNPLNNNLVALWTPHLLKGGSLALRIFAFRKDNFDGDIVVTAKDLPAGVICDPITIGAGMNSGSMVFRASADAPNWGGPVRVTGKSIVAEKEVLREAASGVIVWGSQNRMDNPSRSRLSAGLHFSVSDIDQPPATIDIDPQSIETCVNGKFEIPITITRRSGFKEPIRFFDSILPRTITFGFDELDQRNNDKTEVIAKMNVRNNARPGIYTIVMQGVSRVNGYRRNPEEANAATNYKSEADKRLKEINEKLKVTERERSSLEKKIAQGKVTIKQVKKELSATSEANQQLQKKLDHAESTQKQAEQKRDEFAAQIQLFKVEKATAETAVNQAIQLVKRTTQYSQPKSFNYTCYSRPTKLTVHAAPFEIKLESNEITVPIGEKATLAFAVKRFFELRNPISVLLFSKNGKEIQAKEIALESNETDGALQIEASKKTKPGIYPMLIRARTPYNGQVSLVELKLNVTVVGAAKAASSGSGK